MLNNKDRKIKDLSDFAFIASMVLLGGFYLCFIIGLLLADSLFVTSSAIAEVFRSPEIRYAIKLSLVSCSITAILSLWVSIPIGYLMSRFEFRGKAVIDSILDIPIVLPPLVIGLSLLIFFKVTGDFCEQLFPELFNALDIKITYGIPSVILAQFMVACAFAVRTMRATFDQINPRREQVALTLGCTRSQAFWSVVFPEAQRGVLTAGTLAWARALGEFGPILIFSGATRMKTEVLSTTVFLEMSSGNIEGAVAVSLLMVLVAAMVLFIIRVFGNTKNVFSGRQL